MKYIILVGDGMGDFPIAELNGRTPLEAAHTPAMDFLAREGEFCLVPTIPPGFPPGSDVANLSLLGYSPEKYYAGRAPLEAASMGVALAPDETAFRCNLVTLERVGDNRLIMDDYSAGHISTSEAREIIKTLDRELGSDLFRFYPGVSYRHLMVYKGESEGLVTVPPHDHTGRDVTEFRGRYRGVPQMAELLLRADTILASHTVNTERVKRGEKPANGIWLWGEGKAPSMPTFQECYGVSGALISAVDLLKGIGVYAGMQIINVDGATGYLDTNYAGKAKAALTALQEKDLVFVHVEAPDEASHQGLLAEKIQAIEDFDAKIVQPVLDGLRGGEDFRLLVAMDHFTPLSTRTHAELPVPVVLYDSRGKDKGSGLGFTEENAAKSGRVMADGDQLLKHILGQD